MVVCLSQYMVTLPTFWIKVLHICKSKLVASILCKIDYNYTIKLEGYSTG
jgi:hypothetical protein